MLVLVVLLSALGLQTSEACEGPPVGWSPNGYQGERISFSIEIFVFDRHFLTHLYKIFNVLIVLTNWTIMQFPSGNMGGK